jgi:hypothetical protein
MALNKTAELISTCDAAFKRSGLLRLAETAVAQPVAAHKYSSSKGQGPLLGRTENVPSWNQGLGAQLGNAALDLKSAADSGEWASAALLQEQVAVLDGGPQSGMVRPLGLEALDKLLPDGGLPTGKVIELRLSGGAACGTQLALWACRAAQQQAQLNGTDSWCAFIDPTASLHAPGVLSNGVSLPRLLVLRPNIEDVERVALRLSEANVFSVIIIDLVGVPWLSSRAGARSGARLELNPKRQNWNRTVRQLALRLEHTQAQVLLLTNSDTHLSLPLPVALRLHMRADTRGVDLHVAKDSRGRVGAQATVPWSIWGSDRSLPANEEQSTERSTVPSSWAFPQPERAITLPLSRYRETLAKVPLQRSSEPVTYDRGTALTTSREVDIPIVASTRLARTSRASL